jgi:FMN reductase
MYLVLSTSLNPKSRSRVLAQEVHRRMTKLVDGDQNVVYYDLKDHPLPLCDGGACYGHAEAQQLSEVISAAQGIVMATPVYNYDVSATAKNVLELTGDAWEEKVAGFVCAAGGLGSYMSVMGLANSLMLDYRTFIVPRFVFATGKSFDEQFRLTDEKIMERLDVLAESMVRVTTALRGSVG